MPLEVIREAPVSLAARFIPHAQAGFLGCNLQPGGSLPQDGDQRCQMLPVLGIAKRAAAAKQKERLVIRNSLAKPEAARARWLPVVERTKGQRPDPLHVPSVHELMRGDGHHIGRRMAVADTDYGAGAVLQTGAGTAEVQQEQVARVRRSAKRG